jgi:methylenetetrahydrofolate dehydrogenase (NADP+)/methenyltetrahydrofolate cyclohydrolase
MTIRLAGPPVAEAVLATARAAVQAGRAAGRPHPQLVSLHRAATSPFAVYLRQQAKAAESVGIGFTPVALPPETTATSLRALVEKFGADPAVHAVLLEHPLPPAWNSFDAISTLPAPKDVDGIGAENLGRLIARTPLQVPAVAQAALAIARHHGVAVAGKRVAVIGRSETVGLPLALLLLLKGPRGDATVTVAHSQTPNLAAALAGAEVIFSCAGQPALLTRSVVPKGAAVIDVGLSTAPDPTTPGKVHIVGDADAAELDGWASALTPVPGGVGPVTVACLMQNAAEGWKAVTAAGR